MGSPNTGSRADGNRKKRGSRRSPPARWAAEDSRGVRMRLLCVLLLLVLAVASCGGGEGAKDGNSSFQDRLGAGATCGELFGIRNAVDPKSPLIDRMNQDLRAIGCYSVSSVRTDQKVQNNGVGPGAAASVANSNSFTVQEYRIYREVMDTPMEVSESKALESVARKYGVSVDEARKSVNAVQEALSSNNWFGTPESEIRRASDWRGEAP